jgi:hypothetical protein
MMMIDEIQDVVLMGYIQNRVNFEIVVVEVELVVEVEN